MKAIVLAENTKAEVMRQPVHGEPLLLHTLRWFKRYGVSEVVVSLPEPSESLQDIAGDDLAFGLDMQYMVAAAPTDSA